MNRDQVKESRCVNKEGTTIKAHLQETSTLKTESFAASPHKGTQLFSEPAATRQFIRTVSLKFSCASQASLSPHCIRTAGNGNPTSVRVVSHSRNSGWTMISSAKPFSDFSSLLFSPYCLSESPSVSIAGKFTIFYERNCNDTCSIMVRQISELLIQGPLQGPYSQEGIHYVTKLQILPNHANKQAFIYCPLNKRRQTFDEPPCHFFTLLHFHQSMSLASDLTSSDLAEEAVGRVG